MLSSKDKANKKLAMIIPLCIKKIFIEFLLCYWHWSTFSEKYNNAMFIKNRSILRSLLISQNIQNTEAQKNTIKFWDDSYFQL